MVLRGPGYDDHWALRGNDAVQARRPPITVHDTFRSSQGPNIESTGRTQRSIANR